MLKYTIFLLITAIGLSACAGSKAQNQADKNTVISSPETTQIVAQPTPKKKPKSNDNSVVMTDEDIKNGSVKSDDYEENMQSVNRNKDVCSVEAFVADTDKNGLNVRREDRANAESIGKIPFSEDGTMVHLTGTNFVGWVKINHAVNMESETVFDQEGWVSANLLATSTTGYNGKGVKLYEAGKGTKVIKIVPPETVVKIVSCDKDWVRVKYKKFTGWLDPDSQCGNPVTNCS